MMPDRRILPMADGEVYMVNSSVVSGWPRGLSLVC